MIRVDPSSSTGSGIAGTGASSKGEAARAEGPSGFRAGQTVQVELVKSLGRDEALLKIAGRYFRAVVPPGLPSATPMTLKVADPGPPLLLELPDAWSGVFARLAHPSGLAFSAASSQLAGLAGEGKATPEAAALLTRLAELLSLPREPEALAAALARFVRLSGLFHEADGAAGAPREDVKALLLRLLSMTGEAGGEKAERLLSALLSHLETHQARSLLEGSRFLPLFLPWWNPDDPPSAELELNPEGASGERAASGLLTLRLDLPHLGGLEALVRWTPAGTAVTLRVQPAVEEWMAERAELLREALAAAPGVRLAALSVEPLPPAPPATTRGLLEVTA